MGADLKAVTFDERRHARLHTLTVAKRAVTTSQVLDNNSVAVLTKPAMKTGHALVVEAQVGACSSTDHHGRQRDLECLADVVTAHDDQERMGTNNFVQRSRYCRYRIVPVVVAHLSYQSTAY